MSPALIILIQLVFAAFCFMAAFYIGNLRKYAKISTNAFGPANAVHDWLQTDWAFDVAMLGLAVAFGAFVEQWALSVVFVLIFRLVFTKVVNLIENSSFFYLDENKRIDRFVKYALKLPFGPVGAAVVEVIILAAAIVLINWLFLF